jgi:hypothetical protein
LKSEGAVIAPGSRFSAGRKQSIQSDNFKVLWLLPNYEITGVCWLTAGIL